MEREVLLATPPVPVGPGQRIPLGLTQREYETVCAIERLSRGGRTPSYQEIAVALRLSSKSSVARLVDQLEAKGWLARRVGSNRSLRLLASASPDRQREALGVALEFILWAFGQGWGLIRILDECQIQRPDKVTEPEARALVADHWLALVRFAEAREVGHG